MAQVQVLNNHFQAVFCERWDYTDYTFQLRQVSVTHTELSSTLSDLVILEEGIHEIFSRLDRYKACGTNHISPRELRTVN